MRRQLVVDKSYANAWPDRVAELAKHYQVLVPSAFYYEVLTTPAKKRLRELRRFPQFQRGDVYSAIQSERVLGCAVGFECCSYVEVNPATTDANWSLASRDAAVLRSYEDRVLNPWLDFWLMLIESRAIPGFTCEELAATTSSDEEFFMLCTTLRQESRMRRIAKESHWPHFASLDCGWVHYRFLQAVILQGLILLRRHRGPGDIVSRVKLEHDFHDMEYLTLGLAVKALATSEDSDIFSKFPMAWRYRLLEPRGVLITF